MRAQYDSAREKEGLQVSCVAKEEPKNIRVNTWWSTSHTHDRNNNTMWIIITEGYWKSHRSTVIYDFILVCYCTCKYSNILYHFRDIWHYRMSWNSTLGHCMGRGGGSKVEGMGTEERGKSEGRANPLNINPGNEPVLDRSWNIGTTMPACSVKVCKLTHQN